MTTNNIKKDYLSKPFNPIIANMFYKAGFVESWGKGTNNVVSNCKKMHLSNSTNEKGK